MTDQKNRVAIIGYGYVGKAMHKIFPNALIYDERFCAEVGFNINGMSEEELNLHDVGLLNISSKQTINETAGLAIICVPTPMVEGDEEFKEVDTSIVTACVRWLESPLILIKSTVPPGTTDKLEAMVKAMRSDPPGICFSPEYVGEGKYQITPWQYMSPTDPRTHEFVIIGGRPGVRDQVANYFVRELGPEKTYNLVEAVEAEIIKYMENSWGAMKVIFANEFYHLCQQFGASYIRVREGWALDNRVERMHTAVFVDNEGFAGKCYPKDLNGIVVAAEAKGVDMSLIKAVLRKNKTINKDE